MLKRSTSNTSLFVMIVSIANPKLLTLKLLITLEKFRFWLGKPFQNGKYFMKMNKSFCRYQWMPIISSVTKEVVNSLV